MKKKTRYWEVVEKTPFGEKRLGISKGRSASEATNKLARKKSLPSNVTTYPVKLTKKKDSFW